MKALKNALTVAFSVLISATMANSLTADAVTVQTPIENSFFWLGSEPYPITGGIESNVQSIEFKYLHRIAIDDNTIQPDHIDTIYPTPNTHSFSISLANLEQDKNYSSNFPYPHFNADGTQSGPFLKVVTHYTNGTYNTQYRKFSYIVKDQDYYEDWDSTFYYNYFAGNSFCNTATGHVYHTHNNYLTYNCLAYAFDHSYSGWVWDDDFENNNDNRSLVISFVSTNYNYLQNTNPYHAGANAIAYGTYNHIVHFAKVESWKQNTGEPKTITSKWGGLEVIESKNPNPFSSASIYGSPLIFFNSP